MDALSPAETALQLLFKKLHPHLEDAAHALSVQESVEALEKRHHKLLRAREKAVEALESLVEACDDEALADVLAELADNLTPVGETYAQSLTLTQLCLEEAPDDLLPFLPCGTEGAPWRARMERFCEQVQQPGFDAEHRWARIAPEIGEESESDA
ncbi:MAG: hypothetical protein LWX11_01960 [Firmicutes bacterium]|nr:hypothetical protein [Bacillota bacterium]